MRQADPTVINVESLFHPVFHYESPNDVVDNSGLSTDEKRVVLSSWASDIYVVESNPTLREIPGIPHRLRLEDILAALKRLDGDSDPPPRGGLAMRLPRFSKVDGAASEAPRLVMDRRAATTRYRSSQASRPRNHLRWTREANVRRYRKLLNTHLTDFERRFVERRLAEELHHYPVPMEGINVC